MNSTNGKADDLDCLICFAKNYVSDNQLDEKSDISLNLIRVKGRVEIEGSCFWLRAEYSENELQYWLEELVESDLIKRFERQKKGLFKVWFLKRHIFSAYSLL